MSRHGPRYNTVDEREEQQVFHISKDASRAHIITSSIATIVSSVFLLIILILLAYSYNQLSNSTNAINSLSSMLTTSELHVNVTNFPTTFAISNLVDLVNISVNIPDLLSVTVTNPVEVFSPNGINVTVTNPTTTVEFPSTINVTVTNPTTTVEFPSTINVTVTNPVEFPSTINVTVTNPTTTVTVENLPAVQSVFLLNSDLNVTVTNPVTNVTVDFAPVQFPSAMNVTVENVPISPAKDSLDRTLVSIANPITAYEGLPIEQFDPVFTEDAVYGIDITKIFEEEVGTGTVTSSNSNYIVDSGATANSYAVMQSRKRLKYKNGQSSKCIFSASFTSNTNSSNQLAGLGNSEDGVYFGYYNESSEFGILYEERGVREVRLLTLGGSVSASELATIVLDGTTFPVTLTSNSLFTSTAEAAFDIARSLFPTWQVQTQGGLVYFVSVLAGPRTGTYSFSSVGTVTGSFTQPSAGVSATRTFIPQSTWNVDPLNGLGPSRVVLYPSLFNVYSIALQNTNSGGIQFFVQINGNATQRTQFVNVHTILIPNSKTSSPFGNPSFPFMAISRNLGYTGSTNAIKISSFAGFVVQNRHRTGKRIVLDGDYFTTIGVGAAAALQGNDVNVLSIQNALYYNSRTVQGTIQIEQIYASGYPKLGSGGVVYPMRIRIYKTYNNLMPNIQKFGAGVTETVVNFQPITGVENILITRDNQNYVNSFEYSTLYSNYIPMNVGINGMFLLERDKITLEPGEYLTVVFMYPNLGTLQIQTNINIIVNIDY